MLWRAARCGGCGSLAGYKGRSEACCQTTAQSGKQLLQAPAHPVSVYSDGTVLFILLVFVYTLDKGNVAERFCLVVLFFLFFFFFVFSISVCFFSISVFFFSISGFFFSVLLDASGLFLTLPLFLALCCCHSSLVSEFIFYQVVVFLHLRSSASLLLLLLFPFSYFSFLDYRQQTE